MNPIPPSTRVTDPGSGTVVVELVKVPLNDDVVELVFVPVPIMVDLPVSPAKIPVPPVSTVLIVMAVVSPLEVPLPVKVPNTVPPANTSTHVPLDVNVVKLVKVRVAMFVAV